MTDQLINEIINLIDNNDESVTAFYGNKRNSGSARAVQTLRNAQGGQKFVIKCDMGELLSTKIEGGQKFITGV